MKVFFLFKYISYKKKELDDRETKRNKHLRNA